MEKKPSTTPVSSSGGDQLSQKGETAIHARELAADVRESAADSRDIELLSREQLATLREDALRERAEADHLRADCERVLREMREANEKLVLATLRADELAEEANAARAAITTSAEALLESEARYRTLFRSIDEGFCVIEVLYDIDGVPVDFRYLETNPAFEKQSGLRDVVGKRVREFLPDLETHWFETYGDVSTTGRPARFVHEAKSLNRWLDVYAFCIGGGGTPKVACLFTDITERRRADAQLRAASRAKDEFIAMLGHELRNPLAPIITALDLISMRDSNTFRREHEVIRRQTKHLVHLVDDLLDVSRITNGKIDLHLEPVEIAEVVARAVETASPLLEQKSHELIVNVALRGLPVDADLTRLTQVMANLLTNAAKYTPARGTIVVTSERGGNRLFVRVRDTGIGISKEMLSRVFDLFTQERQALDRSGGGLGLGLAIVKSLVSMHGGTVTARSEGFGRGSEFEIELPTSTLCADMRGEDVYRSEETRGEGARPVEPATTARKLLVVDDNRDAADLMADLLSQRGYEVRVAFDGPSALAVVGEFIPDVALLDIGLPVMDGYELANQLRTLIAPREARYIAISGYGQAVDRSRSIDAGFASHLTKPVDIELLQARIEQATERVFVDPARS